jgi:hypothetical protein
MNLLPKDIVCILIDQVPNLGYTCKKFYSFESKKKKIFQSKARIALGNLTSIPLEIVSELSHSGCHRFISLYRSYFQEYISISVTLEHEELYVLFKDKNKKKKIKHTQPSLVALYLLGGNTIDSINSIEKNYIYRLPNYTPYPISTPLRVLEKKLYREKRCCCGMC